MWLDVLVAMAPAWPAIGALLIAIGLVARKDPPSERVVVWIATVTLLLSFASVTAGGFRWLAAGFHPIDLRFGYWFRAGDHRFALAFLVDGTSLPVSFAASVLLLATCRFSAHYLHREPGFVRFFVLMLAFAAGMQLLLLGGGVALLFAGWELVGLTSVLLVMFFHERQGPVRAGIRVLVTYRICDIGLVLAAVVMHRAFHTIVFRDAFPQVAAASGATMTTIGISVVIAAIGKSAQVPVGGWLPRAMEGPTASSAIFYGGLSVHAGVYLLIRFAPLFAHAPAARLLLVVVGIVTAIVARLAAQVATDAKTALAYATITQVALMFIEVGVGLAPIATIHLVAHAILRYYQFLRTPSVLQDALARRGALGATLADEAAARWELLGLERRRFLYRLSLERFEVEAALDRWLVRPVLKLSGWLDAAERHAMHDEFPEERKRPTKPIGQEATR